MWVLKFIPGVPATSSPLPAAVATLALGLAAIVLAVDKYLLVHRNFVAFRVTEFKLRSMQADFLASFDAALVDGASAWQRARLLTIPLLAPQLVITTVWLSYSTLTGLGVVLALTGGGPLGATTTLAMEMYNVAFRSLRFNEALALATFILVLNAVLTLMYVAVARRYEIEV